MAERKTNKNSEIVFTCVEEKFYKAEVILDNHSFVRVLSGEMKLVMADDSYLFGAGDTLLFPRNQLATAIKYPKDGKPYKSIALNFTAGRLREFYAKNIVKNTEPHTDKIIKLSAHPLLESFFASLLPYLDLSDELPEKITSVKIEEAISILQIINPNIDHLLANFEHPGKINLAEFMEKHYMFNMNIGKFGYLTGRSLTTFKRDFKKAFHVTPQRWLTQKRLEFAHYHIAVNKRKASEVCYESGFENLSHFSYAFKKQFGYAPTEIPSPSK
jgi:AraC-like DNA-binding protein